VIGGERRTFSDLSCWIAAGGAGVLLDVEGATACRFQRPPCQRYPYEIPLDRPPSHLDTSHSSPIIFFHIDSVVARGNTNRIVGTKCASYSTVHKMAVR
jgi:hypothetical protein